MNFDRQLEDFKKYLRKSGAKVAVSLSSGGAEAMGRDLALMEMLTELDIPYEEIHGTSAGAPVAATYCFFKPLVSEEYDSSKRELSIYELRRRYIKVMSFSTIFSLSFKSMRRLWRTWRAKSITGIFSGNRLERKINITMNGHFKDCFKDVYIYAESEGQLEYQVFSKKNYPDMLLSKAVRASISMPHVFEPQKLDGRNFIDGGLLVNTPLQVIYENHLSDKKNKKRPLIIFSSTSMYPLRAIKKDKNIWTVMKDRYFYKLMNRIFFMEFSKLLSNKNVTIFLFYPQLEKIHSFAFNKVESYLIQNKNNFYRLLGDYLQDAEYRSFFKKMKFHHRYNLEFGSE